MKYQKLVKSIESLPVTERLSLLEILLLSLQRDEEAWAATLDQVQAILPTQRALATERKHLLIDIEDKVCLLKPIEIGEYSELARRTLPIKQYSWFQYKLVDSLRKSNPDFRHPQVYALLRTLFGESTTLYDSYKCSFGYPFLLKITGEGATVQYLMQLTDFKGTLEFQFGKIFSPAEFKPYFKDRTRVFEPFADFTEEEIKYCMAWFSGYLSGYIESWIEAYQEPFVRSLDDRLTLYGYLQNRFFITCYENQEEYREARHQFYINGNVPFNRIR